MKINPCLCLTKQQKIVACTCKITGINSALIVPAISGYAFEYVHPLSYFNNCIGMVKQGEEYLRSLEQQILSGLFISCYQHYELLDLLELTAQEANAIFCTASTATLIEALTLVPLFTKQNVVASPIFSVYWKGLQDQHDVNEELANYVRRLAKDFKDPHTSSEERKQMQITVLNRSAIAGRINNGYISIKTGATLLSDSEKDFEEEFKANKKEVRRLITSLGNASLISPEFATFLKSVNKDRNMITMSQSLKDKVAQKLQDKQHPDALKLASIISNCQDPYGSDIVEAVLPVMDKKIRTLAEILADKRRKSQVIAQDEESLEVLSAAQDLANGVPSVEEYDAEIDAEEEEEIEAMDDKLEALNAPRSFGEDF
jgi:hypothetical protein